ncbi:ABC transporter substrate-binding protein [Desulfobacterales bacterium HSG2]|nr:ABC transporter substrate-binding protein [Desulfobacterales bacterium HSG2]
MIFIIAVVLIFSSAAYGRTYKIAIVQWAGWSAANVADVKGFWKDRGIDVRVVVCADNVASQNLFKKKRVDIIFDMIGSAIGMFAEGFPVTIIAETDWSHGGDRIICREGSDSIQQLRGTAVGVYLNQPSVTYFLDRYLSTVGLKLSDVRIVEMETKALADNFIRGRFKAIVCYDPDAIRAEKEGGGKVVATSADYEGCIPEGMMVMDDVLKDIPQKDLSDIFRGWIKAVNWSLDRTNWEEYMKILNEHTFKDETPYSEKELGEMFDAVRIHNIKRLAERNHSAGGLMTYLKELRAFLKMNNQLKKDFNPDDIFNNRVIMEVLKSAGQ